ncbi:DnaB-like helicase N-terminal domain-containing protein [Streptomyces avidinii]|uniref:DnaB-like helicase N-terminal domain-containing protein n=1 Tax=Streptomyces avidinii TaxID=1895 RepID=UPI00379C4874
MPHPAPMDMNAVPPHDVEAEAAVLGVCTHGANVIDAVRNLLDGPDFYRPAHETVWRTLLALRSEDLPTDPIVLSNRLQEQGDLDRIGGRVYAHQLYGATPSADNAIHYAGIVREKAKLRRLRASGIRTVQRTMEPGADPDVIRGEIEPEVRAERERALASGQGRLSRFITDGWSFVTESGADTEPLWGTREQTAWSSGESLMLVGAPGVGKTALAHQVVLARLGPADSVLDMPVAHIANNNLNQTTKALHRGIAPEGLDDTIAAVLRAAEDIQRHHPHDQPRRNPARLIPSIHPPGRSTAGLLAYLYGSGRSEEHVDPHLVASFDGLAPDPGREPGRHRGGPPAAPRRTPPPPPRGHPPGQARLARLRPSRPRRPDPHRRRVGRHRPPGQPTPPGPTHFSVGPGGMSSWPYG